MIEALPSQLRAERIEGSRCPLARAKVHRHHVLRDTNLRRRLLQRRHRPFIMLKIRIQELQHVACDPGIADNPIRPRVIAFATARIVLPYVLISLVYRAVLYVHQRQVINRNQITTTARGRPVSPTSGKLTPCCDVQLHGAEATNVV